MPTTRTDGVIRMLPGERFTPFALAKKLNAKILFESSSFERGRARYSLLVLDEAFRLIQRGDDILFQTVGGQEQPFDSAPARDILDNTCRVIAIELAAAAQGIDLGGDVTKKKLGAGSRAAYDCVRRVVEPLKGDRIMCTDFEAVLKLVKSGEIVAAVEKAVGPLC